MRSFGRKVMMAVLHCCAAALALASAAARGGEAPVVVEKKPEEKAFDFDPGDSRDPFTFRKKGKETAPVSPNRGPGITTPEVKTREDIDLEQIRLKRAEAEKWYGEAEQAFMLESGADTRAPDVVLKCDKGLEALKNLAGLDKFPDVMQVREKLLDLRRAGERVRQRQEAEKRFRDMNIRLTGVVARERRSQAIVNGKTVGKGEVVAVSDNYDVVVDEIRPDHVIFLFQGYKMMLSLSDMPRSR